MRAPRRDDLQHPPGRVVRTIARPSSSASGEPGPDRLGRRRVAELGLCALRGGRQLARAGKYDEAEDALRRSHTIIETAFGKRHAQTAKAISNLALVRYLRGDAAAAATMFRDALAIEEETLGGDHTSVASTLVNLGAVETALGETDHAEATLRRALAIREQHLPPGDSRIFEVTVPLGTLLVETNRFADARPLLLL